MSLTNDLARLTALYSSGILSLEEYTEAKRQLLGFPSSFVVSGASVLHPNSTNNTAFELTQNENEGRAASSSINTQVTSEHGCTPVSDKKAPARLAMRRRDIVARIVLFVIVMWFVVMVVLTLSSIQHNNLTVQVLIATKPIAAWQKIRDPEAFFQVSHYQQSAVPYKALRSCADIQSRRLNKPINEGGIVLSDDLLSLEHDRLFDRLSPHDRLMQLTVEDSSPIATVPPGKRYNVLYTPDRERHLGEGPILLLNHMLVLGGYKTHGRTSKGDPLAYRYVIALVVTQDESEQLSTAIQTGTLRLSPSE